MNRLPLLRKLLLPMIASFACGVIVTLATSHVLNNSATSHAVELNEIHDAQLGRRFIGNWTVDRTDTEATDDGRVAFQATGQYVDDDVDTIDARWFCSNGCTYLVYRSNDDLNAKPHVLSFQPVFDKSGEFVTLSPPGDGTKLTMTKTMAVSPVRG